MARENSRSNARSRSSAPNMLPVFATLGVVVLAALVVAVMNKKDDPVEAAQEDEARSAAAANSVFGDIDTSRERFMPKGVKVSTAPPGLADSPVFAEGRALAAKARESLAKAKEAEAAGDAEGYRKHAIAAREDLEKALEVTAEWEFELGNKWGSDDPQVKRIGAETETWSKDLKKVRKVH